MVKKYKKQLLSLSTGGMSIDQRVAVFAVQRNLNAILQVQSRDRYLQKIRQQIDNNFINSNNQNAVQKRNELVRMLIDLRQLQNRRRDGEMPERMRRLGLIKALILEFLNLAQIDADYENNSFATLVNAIIRQQNEIIGQGQNIDRFRQVEMQVYNYGMQYVTRRLVQLNLIQEDQLPEQFSQFVFDGRPQTFLQSINEFLAQHLNQQQFLQDLDAQNIGGNVAVNQLIEQQRLEDQIFRENLRQIDRFANRGNYNVRFAQHIQRLTETVNQIIQFFQQRVVNNGGNIQNLNDLFNDDGDEPRGPNDGGVNPPGGNGQLGAGRGFVQRNIPMGGGQNDGRGGNNQGDNEGQNQFRQLQRDVQLQNNQYLNRINDLQRQVQQLQQNINDRPNQLAFNQQRQQINNIEQQINRAVQDIQQIQQQNPQPGQQQQVNQIIQQNRQLQQQNQELRNQQQQIQDQININNRNNEQQAQQRNVQPANLVNQQQENFQQIQNVNIEEEIMRRINQNNENQNIQLAIMAEIAHVRHTQNIIDQQNQQLQDINAEFQRLQNKIQNNQLFQQRGRQQIQDFLQTQQVIQNQANQIANDIRRQQQLLRDILRQADQQEINQEQYNIMTDQIRDLYNIQALNSTRIVNLIMTISQQSLFFQEETSATDINQIKEQNRQLNNRLQQQVIKQEQYDAQILEIRNQQREQQQVEQRQQQQQRQQNQQPARRVQFIEPNAAEIQNQSIQNNVDQIQQNQMITQSVAPQIQQTVRNVQRQVDEIQKDVENRFKDLRRAQSQRQTRDAQVFDKMVRVDRQRNQSLQGQKKGFADQIALINDALIVFLNSLAFQNENQVYQINNDFTIEQLARKAEQLTDARFMRLLEFQQNGTIDQNDIRDFNINFKNKIQNIIRTIKQNIRSGNDDQLRQNFATLQEYINELQEKYLNHSRVNDLQRDMNERPGMVQVQQNLDESFSSTRSVSGSMAVGVDADMSMQQRFDRQRQAPIEGFIEQQRQAKDKKLFKNIEGIAGMSKKAGKTKRQIEEDALFERRQASEESRTQEVQTMDLEQQRLVNTQLEDLKANFFQEQEKLNQQKNQLEQHLEQKLRISEQDQKISLNTFFENMKMGYKQFETKYIDNNTEPYSDKFITISQAIRLINKYRKIDSDFNIEQRRSVIDQVNQSIRNSEERIKETQKNTRQFVEDSLKLLQNTIEKNYQTALQQINANKDQHQKLVTDFQEATNNLKNQIDRGRHEAGQIQNGVEVLARIIDDYQQSLAQLNLRQQEIQQNQMDAPQQLIIQHEHAQAIQQIQSQLSQNLQQSVQSIQSQISSQQQQVIHPEKIEEVEQIQKSVEKVVQNIAEQKKITNQQIDQQKSDLKNRISKSTTRKVGSKVQKQVQIENIIKIEDDSRGRSRSRDQEMQRSKREKTLTRQASKGIKPTEMTVSKSKKKKGIKQLSDEQKKKKQLEDQIQEQKEMTQNVVNQKNQQEVSANIQNEPQYFEQRDNVQNQDISHTVVVVEEQKQSEEERQVLQETINQINENANTIEKLQQQIDEMQSSHQQNTFQTALNQIEQSAQQQIEKNQQLIKADNVEQFQQNQELERQHQQDQQQNDSSAMLQQFEQQMEDDVISVESEAQQGTGRGKNLYQILQLKFVESQYGIYDQQLANKALILKQQAGPLVEDNQPSLGHFQLSRNIPVMTQYIEMLIQAINSAKSKWLSSNDKDKFEMALKRLSKGYVILYFSHFASTDKEINSKQDRQKNILNFFKLKIGKQFKAFQIKDHQGILGFIARREHFNNFLNLLKKDFVSKIFKNPSVFWTDIFKTLRQIAFDVSQHTKEQRNIKLVQKQIEDIVIKIADNSIQQIIQQQLEQQNQDQQKNVIFDQLPKSEKQAAIQLRNEIMLDNKKQLAVIQEETFHSALESDLQKSSNIKKMKQRENAHKKVLDNNEMLQKGERQLSKRARQKSQFKSSIKIEETGIPNTLNNQELQARVEDSIYSQQFKQSVNAVLNNDRYSEANPDLTNYKKRQLNLTKNLQNIRKSINSKFQNETYLRNIDQITFIQNIQKDVNLIQMMQVYNKITNSLKNSINDIMINVMFQIRMSWQNFAFFMYKRKMSAKSPDEPIFSHDFNESRDQLKQINQEIQKQLFIQAFPLYTYVLNMLIEKLKYFELVYEDELIDYKFMVKMQDKKQQDSLINSIFLLINNLKYSTRKFINYLSLVIQQVYQDAANGNYFSQYFDKNGKQFPLSAMDFLFLILHQLRLIFSIQSIQQNQSPRFINSLLIQQFNDATMFLTSFLSRNDIFTQLKNRQDIQPVQFLGFNDETVIVSIINNSKYFNYGNIVGEQYQYVEQEILDKKLPNQLIQPMSISKKSTMDQLDAFIQQIESANIKFFNSIVRRNEINYYQILSSSTNPEDIQFKLTKFLSNMQQQNTRDQKYDIIDIRLKNNENDIFQNMFSSGQKSNILVFNMLRSTTGIQAQYGGFIHDLYYFIEFLLSSKDTRSDKDLNEIKQNMLTETQFDIQKFNKYFGNFIKLYEKQIKYFYNTNEGRVSFNGLNLNGTHERVILDQTQLINIKLEQIQ